MLDQSLTALGIVASLALQYGCPADVLVHALQDFGDGEIGGLVREALKGGNLTLYCDSEGPNVRNRTFSGRS